MAYPIEIKDLSVSYGAKRVLVSIYLNLEAGHLYGLIGPNGAGKSSLFKALLGLIEPTAGEIKINGGSIEKYRKKIAYVPQKDEIDWSFPANVMDIVLMGRYPHKTLFSTLSKKDKLIAEEALKSLDIFDLKDRQIGQLSGGQQQRVFFARALAQNADIFLLDEPFVGIDATTEKRIIDLLKKLAKEGKTLLVVHHDLDTVSRYFSKVICLNQRLVAYGDTEKIFTPEIITKTYEAQLPLLHRAAESANK